MDVVVVIGEREARAAQVLERDQLERGEGVVDLGEVHVLGTEAGHRERLAGGRPGGGEGDQLATMTDGQGVRPLPEPGHPDANPAGYVEYPNVNAAMDEEGNLHVYQDVHLGVAVDTPKGLFVPVVKNAESLNLAGLAKAIADVAKRTRDGKIDPGELSGSTISLTNTGSRGAVWDTPIINQPNAAIFATPAIVKRPVVVEDPDLGEVVVVRHMMYGILTYDHRIIDGADAARFLVKVKEVLEAADFEGDLNLERE